MSPLDEADAGSPAPNGEERLDSWKAIASYLKRDVRTVQRWERTEGLPVRRHAHQNLATIYAYPSEIEAWLKSREAGSASLPPDDNQSRVSSPRWISLGALLLLAVLATAWLVRLTSPDHGGQTQVLIARFDDRTGQSQFDGLVEDTLRRELGSTPGLAVVSNDRIGETLSLMRQSPDMAVDAKTAREIARRDGDIQVLVTGALERFGSAYRVTAELIDPMEGAVLETVSEDASGESELLSTLRSISKATGAALAAVDAWSEDGGAVLERVTTSSLEALELYTQAMALTLEGRWNIAAAEEILSHAVAEDPEFASAHIELAYAMEAQGKPASDYMASAARALELSPSVSERERYFIEGSYHKLHDEPTAAEPHFVALTELYPDHYWGLLKVAEVQRSLGNLQGAAFDMARAADMRPDAAEANARAFNFILETGELWTADRVFERLTQFPFWNGPVHDIPQVEFFQAGRYLMNGNAGAALDEAERLRDKLDSLPQNARTPRSEYAARLAELYIALGQLRVAEELLEILRDDQVDERQDTFVSRRRDETRLVPMLALSRNEPCCVAGVMPEGPAAVQWNILMVRAGRTPVREAGGLQATAILQGELARAQGNNTAAMDLLKAALDKVEGRRRSYWPHVFLAVETLAGLLADAGELTEAIGLLEEWSGERAKARAFMFPPTFSPYWVKVRWKLAEFYREAGQVQEAEAIESYLRSLFAVADEDHFFVVNDPATTPSAP